MKCVTLEIHYRYFTTISLKLDILELDRDATTKRFYYHQQTKAFADKELLNHRETLSQTQLSHSNKGLINLGHNKGQNGQIESNTILRNSWASSSVRIEHQPPKLGVEGSNPSPPATKTDLEPNSVLDCSMDMLLDA